jgi:hypothetical protein
MKENEQQIGVNLSYALQIEKSNEAIHKTCVSLYKKHIKTACKLEPQHSLFLDTNVLLGYYQLPYKAREKFYLFLKENKDNIYICNQVQFEFDKHRAVVIKQYQKQLHIESPTPYQNTVRSLIEKFLDLNDDVLEAYPKFQEELKGVYLNSLAILEKLKVWGEEKIDACKKQLQKQDIVDLLPQLQQLPRMKRAEYEFIRKEFDQLRIEAETFKPNGKATAIDTFVYKNPDKIFPGIGDIKKKPKSPYGDYYIFHEILKWTANNPQEAPPIFLTNDVTKRDWLDSNKRTYAHYLENMYLNTNSIFYILHAAQILTKTEHTSFYHLVRTEDILEDVDTAVDLDRKNSTEDVITPSSIQLLLKELYPNRETLEEEDPFWQEVIDELKHDFELISLYELRSDLLENYHLLVQLELRRFCVYDQLDALEYTLEIIYE